jgi:hypothetical protein
MIPEKDRPEWRMLVRGEKSYPLTNFVLQMKVTKAVADLRKNQVSLDKVIDEIYALCQKYEKAVAQDMKTIFG